MLFSAHLVLGAQAARAQVEAFGLPVNDDGGGMNIRCPAAVGMPLGVADVMTEKRCFSA